MDPSWAWRVLGVTAGSDAAAVRAAFRRSALLLHPDRVADLGAEVEAEAHRRMTELGDAYRVCLAIAGGTAPTSAQGEPPSGPLPPAGVAARSLLDEAVTALSRVSAPEAYDSGWPTTLTRADNTATARRVVRLLEQVADAWPGSAEGDRARTLLVTSAAARAALSARERARHLVLVVDPVARTGVWAELNARDELAVAQAVHGHPTAPADLHRQARGLLAESGDWTTLVADADLDVSRTARVRLLVGEATQLAARAEWVGRKERSAYDAEVAAWRDRADVVGEDLDDAGLRAELHAAGAGLPRQLSRRA